ncbi:MAG TPA: MupG family TIM beta-alpha barrel fold protein [Nakamurella sp.]
MYGISVYVADLAAAEQTCAEAHDQGFDRLFTSLHIPEDDPSALPRLLRRLASIAHRNQLALVADISGRTLQALGLDAPRWGSCAGGACTACGSTSESTMRRSWRCPGRCPCI